MKRRQPGTFVAADENNPRKGHVSARVPPRLAEEIDKRRGDTSRSEYVTLLLAFALVQTKDTPPYLLLQNLGEFLNTD